MKKTPLFVVLLTCLGCISCSVTPLNYDLDTTKTYPSINASRNIPNIQIETFTYEPPITISQHGISHLGCIPCASDGSSSGYIFVQPIKEIITSEVKAALEETMLESGSSACKITGQVHLAALDVMNFDTSVDITYILKKQGVLLSLKRVPGYYEKPTFDFSTDMSRWMAEPVRDSVSKLLKNREFVDVVNNECATD